MSGLRYARGFALLTGALLCSVGSFGQTKGPDEAGYDRSSEESFKVYSDHPRLLMSAAKMRLLRRERERQSMRWQQMELLIRGNAPMVEPGFANALFYQTSGDREIGMRAIQWAAGPGTDIRQVALVFDWCQPLLDGPQKQAITAKLTQALQSQPKDASAVRDRLFAAIVLADHTDKDVSSPVIEQTIKDWWRVQTAPVWKKGDRVFTPVEHYAIFEMFHVVRDNIKTDMREDVGRVFADLPEMLLMSYYPAAFPAPENDYRVPFFTTSGDPDLRSAAMARARELCFVAYDPNLRTAQFLQGWLMHDRFAMRSAFGAPYEFLWANPYLPGLSYYHMPLFVHNEQRGELYLRSSWEDDAEWFGFRNGQGQVFRDGKRLALAAGTSNKQIDIGDATVIAARDRLDVDRAKDQPPHIFVIGLQPSRGYCIEVDGEEMVEGKTDRGGILAILSTRTDQRRIQVNPPRVAGAMRAAQ